jgi:phosphoglycerate dehydrogenase-like enzyme
MTAKPLVLLDPHPRPTDLIFDAPTLERLKSFAQVEMHDGSAPAAAAHIDRWLPETWALIGQSPLEAARLARAPKLKVVANVESNFLPNVDYAECHRRGIHVIATGPVFAKAVAEMALGLALAAARRIPQADAALRAGTETLYGTGDNHDSILLGGKTMAIIGCGNLGRALLPLLRGFAGRIIVHDPWIHDSVLREMGVEPVSLAECFAQATCVFILAATTTENAGGIGRRYFETMPKNGIVVLASRAGVVDFDALLDCAAECRIRAAIDVWPEEPIPAGFRGRTVPNTVLQAHRAGNIPEIWPEMGRMVVDDLELILRGLPPQRCQRAVPEIVGRLRSKPVT